MLVIVGKKGYIDDKTLFAIENNSLFVEWISDMKDEELDMHTKSKNYMRLKSGRIWSFLIEGLIHNGIVLANRLTVWRICGFLSYYFDIDHPDSLKF